MEELTISEPIKDASVLGELKNLKKIELRRLNVKDLIILNFCIQLEEVVLKNIEGFESDFDCSGLLKESKAKIVLDLSQNKFERFPNAVTTFQSLTSLSLRACNLSEVPDRIGNLKRLTNLNLSENQLTALPAGIGSLEQLTRFSIYSNQLSTLPDAILSLKKLETLSIQWNRISSLPDGIGSLSSLKDLDFAGNQLSSLPSAISGLIQLTSLDLGKNKFSSFPEEVVSLKNLEELRLSENPFSSVPESIGNIDTLKDLVLEGTQIDSLPQTMEKLTSLNYLNLSKTKLNDVPDFISKMESLKTLHFQSEEYDRLKKWCEFEYSKYINLLHGRKYPEATTKIKHLFSTKGEDFLKLNQWEVKLKISESYYRKAETFAAAVYALATILKDEEIYSMASQMTGDQYIHPVLPFNQACYFAVTGQKEPMLQSIRKSVELGAKADEFTKEKDFVSYLKDPDFLETIGKN
ncbi:leucine rich repeat protein [Leptospira sp. P2653]|nr:leucine rich repeat protein [Leptospira sp. P2653]